MTALSTSTSDAIAQKVLTTCPDSELGWGSLNFEFENWLDRSLGECTIRECSQALSLSDISNEKRMKLHITCGRGYLRIRNYRRAQAEFDEANRFSPVEDYAAVFTSGSLYQFGVHLMSEDEYRDAIALMSLAIQQIPMHHYFLGRGVAYYFLSKASNAEGPEIYQHIQHDLTRWKNEATPSELETNQKWLELLGRVEKAMDLIGCERWTQRTARAEKLFWAADKAEKDGRLQEAVSLYGQYISIQHDDPDGHLKYGMLSYQLALNQNDDLALLHQALIALSHWRDMLSQLRFMTLMANASFAESWRGLGQGILFKILASENGKQIPIVNGIRLDLYSLFREQGIKFPDVLPWNDDEQGSTTASNRQQQEAWIRAGRCEICGGTIGFFDKLTNNRRCKQHR